MVQKWVGSVERLMQGRSIIDDSAGLAELLSEQKIGLKKNCQ